MKNTNTQEIWKKYFPFDKIRECQITAINSIVKAFESKCKYFILEAPTGSGKSAVAVTLSKYFRDNYPGDDEQKSSYILTTQKILQEQYIRDFPELKNISAKNNYECKYRAGISCDMGLTIAKTLSPDADAFKRYKAGCCYTEAKNEFLDADVSLSNLHFFLSNSKHKSTQYYRGLDPRKLLVIDEAHNLENIVIDFAGMTFTRYYAEEVMKLRWPAVSRMTLQQFMDWVRDNYWAQLKIQCNIIQGKIESSRSESEMMSKEMIRLMRKSDEYKKKLESIDNNIKEYNRQPKNWVLTVNSTEDIVNIKPIYIKEYTQPLLFNKADKILLMSATVLDKATYCNSIGIPEAQAEFLSLDSPFPVKNRPVFPVCIGSMARKNITQTLPIMIKTIKELIDHHADEKGIIHCHTYDIAKFISDNLDSDRLLFHSSTDRIDVLNYHMQSPKPTILVSPSFAEGIDLIDDLSRFQIVVKMPFPYMGDKYIKTKMDCVKNWYSWQTIKTVIQACGRSVRTETDWCVTYILDKDWEWFFKQNKDMFPIWWTKALQK